MTFKQACVVGGGFYGCAIALYLKQVKRIPDVSVYEQGPILLGRASYANQARVHNGYHYPRSFTTAYRSHANFGRFGRDWDCCVKSDFRKYYALAGKNSKVTGAQFLRFCSQIEAPVCEAEEDVVRLFNPALIQKVFKVEEYAFDAERLREWMGRELQKAAIDIFLGHRVVRSKEGERGEIDLEVVSHTGESFSVRTPLVFNCTYSGLGQLSEPENTAGFELKHEIAELCLIEPPEVLAGIGITVMDGPFFSVMPFPARGLHSLSHVRYTPHSNWKDQYGLSPYDILNAYPCESRVDRMLRDACRYLPSLAQSHHAESLFEIKTVLTKNETDDGRPILFREDSRIKGMYSILGSKIDNIYDILESIDSLVMGQS
jgi:glycine/D-amino acid oxidase-like deaminating enzyme